MAVYWDWKNKCGELTMKDPRNGKYTINLYKGNNCMTVLLYNEEMIKSVVTKYTKYIR